MMEYIFWACLGTTIAVLANAGLRLRTRGAEKYRAYLMGAFGGVLGGIIGDSLSLVLSRHLHLTSILGAVLGASLFCLALHADPPDHET
jgi:uncharacterized membrane protein YeiH